MKMNAVLAIVKMAKAVKCLRPQRAVLRSMGISAQKSNFPLGMLKRIFSLVAGEYSIHRHHAGINPLS
jgi:hypothetical protein